jgi:hypothetical protein
MSLDPICPEAAVMNTVGMVIISGKSLMLLSQMDSFNSYLS